MKVALPRGVKKRGRIAEGGIMRKNLKVYRVKQGLTQAEMAARLDYTCSLYSMVESGRRTGTQHFWLNLKAAFNLSENEIENLRINE